MPDARHQQQQNAEAISPRAPAPCAFRHVGAQAPIAFERDERAGGPEHQRMKRRKHTIADIALLTPQQQVGGHCGDRANRPTVTADRRHAQHEQTQGQQSENRHERQSRQFGERPTQPAARAVREPRCQNGEQRDDGNLETIAVIRKMGLRVRVNFAEPTQRSTTTAPTRRRQGQSEASTRATRPPRCAHAAAIP